MITTQPITSYGQMKVGDVLIIERRRDGRKFVVGVKEVFNSHMTKEEIVICLGKNDYFIVGMLLNDDSWVKSVVKIPGAELTSITNNTREFPRH